MNQQNEQLKREIDFLNRAVKIKIAPSKVSGVGVFAMQDIPSGTRLYGDMFPRAFKIPFGEFDRLSIEAREYILGRWPRVVKSGVFMWPDTLFQAFMNHATTEEMLNYDCVKDLTIKDIRAGEEIFENYHQIENWEIAFPWLCTIDKGKNNKRK